MAICQCGLSWLPDSRCLCWSLNSSIARWRLPVAHEKKMARVLTSVHAISTTCSLCWTSLCSMLVYSNQARLTVPEYTFYVIFCGLRFSHILMTVKCMELFHVLCMYSVRLAPQCRAFPSYIDARVSEID